MLCYDCGALLTLVEAHFYGTRCETCEGAWHTRIEAWRLGAPDPELDKLFEEKITLH